jgi:hypothetical protein
MGFTDPGAYEKPVPLAIDMTLAADTEIGFPRIHSDRTPIGEATDLQLLFGPIRQNQTERRLASDPRFAVP